MVLSYQIYSDLFRLFLLVLRAPHPENCLANHRSSSGSLWITPWTLIWNSSGPQGTFMLSGIKLAISAIVHDSVKLFAFAWFCLFFQKLVWSFCILYWWLAIFGSMSVRACSWLCLASYGFVRFTVIWSTCFDGLCYNFLCWPHVPLQLVKQLCGRRLV